MNATADAGKSSSTSAVGREVFFSLRDTYLKISLLFPLHSVLQGMLRFWQKVITLPPSDFSYYQSSVVLPFVVCTISLVRITR